MLCGARLLYADDGWETNIIVSAGVAQNKLYFGQRLDATDGKDGQYDIKAFLSGGVKAWFVSPEGALWRDIKSLEGQKSWTINVESGLTDNNISLKWNAASLPAGYNIRLLDKATGTSVNMASTGVYTYRNSGPRDLVIETEAPTTSTSSEEESQQLTDEFYVDVDASADDTSTAQSTASTEDGSSVKYIYGGWIGYYNAWSGDSNENNLNDEEDGNRWEGAGYESQTFSDYEVIVEDANGLYEEDGVDYASLESKDVTEPTGSLLETPADLDGWVQKSRGIYLRWEDFSIGVHVFFVERKEGIEEEWNTIALVAGTSSYHDNIRNLLEDKVYFYRVKAFDGGKESEYSNIVAFDADGKGEVFK